MARLKDGAFWLLKSIKMLLNFSGDGEPFATGAASYRYAPVPGSDDANRILIQVEINEDFREAILDTGGQYFLCAQDVAEGIRPAPEYTLERKNIRFRGETVRGRLHRIDILLLHGEGDYLTVDVTAFLPDPDQVFTPEFIPYSFLGMHCCMERVRFAIDPSEDRFYFGRL